MAIFINIGNYQPKGAGLIPFPPQSRYAMIAEWAINAAEDIARKRPGADSFFKSLPNGMSLTELIKGDIEIWANYITGPLMGFTHIEKDINCNEIAIGEASFKFRLGRVQVLATLIHELAHIAGVEDPKSHLAERAVFECGLGSLREYRTGKDDPRTPYLPGVTGQLLTRRDLFRGFS